jgi:hypothetical protein
MNIVLNVLKINLVLLVWALKVFQQFLTDFLWIESKNKFQLTNSENPCSGIQIVLWPYILQWTYIYLFGPYKLQAEAEFLDVIGTNNSLKSFPPCYSQSPQLTDIPSPPPLPGVFWNWFIMSTLYTETSSLRTLKIIPRGPQLNCTFMNSDSALHCENFDTSLYQDITQFYSGIIYSSVSMRHVGREACSKKIERAGPYITSAPPFTPTSVSWTYPVSGGRGRGGEGCMEGWS